MMLINDNNFNPLIFFFIITKGISKIYNNISLSNILQIEMFLGRIFL